MGAEFALGKADGIDEGVDGVELQRGEVEAAAYLLHEALILGGARGRVLVEVLGIVALKLLDETASHELQVALR